MPYLRLRIFSEIGSILLRGGTYPKKIISNVTDNQSALSWLDGKRVLVGPASRLQQSFRRELIRRHIQVRGMYLRSEHTTSNDFLTRGTEEEIHSWASHHVMTRRSLWGICPQLGPTNSPTWDFAIYGRNRLRYHWGGKKMFAGRIPETFTLREVCLTLRLPHSWIGPYRYEIADLARDYGSSRYSGRIIDFAGSLIRTTDVKSMRVVKFPSLNSLC